MRKEIGRLGAKIERLGFSASATLRDPDTLAEIEAAKEREAKLERRLSELAGDRKPAARRGWVDDGIDIRQERQHNDREL